MAVNSDVSKDNYCLSKQLCIQIITSTIQEVLLHMFIVKCINGWPDDDDDDDYREKYEQHCKKYATIEEKYSQDVPENILLTRAEKNMATFRNNWMFVETIMKNFLKDLRRNENCDSIKHVVEIYKAEQNDREEFLLETERNAATVEDLKKKITSNREHFQKTIEKTNLGIRKLSQQIMELSDDCSIKLKYAKAWQISQMEMTEMLSSKQEEDLSRKIFTTEIDIDKEIRVNEEILCAYELMEKDFLSAVEEWKVRYYKYVDDLNRKITFQKEEKQRQLDKIDRLKQLYAKRQRDIDNYKVHKIELEKIKLQNERINVAATRIQAWWRGTMVRKGFGKFRKKKDKKPKKKSGDKKH